MLPRITKLAVISFYYQATNRVTRIARTLCSRFLIFFFFFFYSFFSLFFFFALLSLFFSFYLSLSLDFPSFPKDFLIVFGRVSHVTLPATFSRKKITKIATTNPRDLFPFFSNLWNYLSWSCLSARADRTRRIWVACSQSVLFFSFFFLLFFSSPSHFSSFFSSFNSHIYLLT